MIARATAGLAPLALSVLLAAPSFADDLRGLSRIDSVLLFPQSADVTRLGEIVIPAGDHRVIFSGLPRSLVADSVRVRFGDEAIVVGAVETSLAYPEGGGPEGAQTLRDRLQELQDQIQMVDDRIAASELQVQFLQTQASAAKGDGGLDPDDWTAALAAIETGVREARSAILAARQERRELERQVQEIQLQLNRWDDDLSLRTDVVVSLSAERDVAGTPLELQYQVTGAGWAALYEARLDSEAANLLLERKIKVFQDSGEDWTAVRLSVSTAPPTAQLAAPTVYTHYLTLMDPSYYASSPVAAPAPAAMGGYAMEAARGAADMPALEELAVDEMNARTRSFETVNASFASSYSVGGRVDVPSDALERTFTIGQEDIAVELAIRTAPRTSLDAFLTAKLTYAGDGPLPPGGLRKYRDGAYLREDYMDTLVPGEEIELGFGVDQQVVVTWVDEGAGQSETGLIGRNTVLDERHRFEALNRHAQPFTVEIVDFQPIAQDDDVVVKIDPEATPPDEKDFQDSPGVVVWRRELAPEAKLEVRNAYTITYPTSGVLIGQ